MPGGQPTPAWESAWRPCADITTELASVAAWRSAGDTLQGERRKMEGVCGGVTAPTLDQHVISGYNFFMYKKEFLLKTSRDYEEQNR